MHRCVRQLQLKVIDDDRFMMFATKSSAFNLVWYGTL